MKIYKTQKEVEKDIKNGELFVNDDVAFECDINIRAHIHVKGDITARNITAWDIDAGDINARNITAWDIKALNITAWDIKARDIAAYNITVWNIAAGNINALNINANNITARDIAALDITAREISYNAFCNAYGSITCTHIEGQRNPCHPPVCLDGKLTIIPEKDMEVENAIKLLTEKGLLKDGKILTN
jgi:hypothetical protein